MKRGKERGLRRHATRGRGSVDEDGECEGEPLGPAALVVRARGPGPPASRGAGSVGIGLRTERSFELAGELG